MVWLLIQTETVQNYLVKKVTKKLSDDLKTEVSIQHVSLTLFNKMNLQKTLIRDRQKDTILYAGQLKLRITDWFFFKDRIELKYIGLEDAVIKLQRKDTVWNYQFIADHFAQSDTTTKKSKPIALDFKKVDLKNVSFLSNDLWVGTKQIIKAGSALIDIEKIDLSKSKIIINEVLLDKPQFLTEEFDGLRPPKPKRKRVKEHISEGDLMIKVAVIKITNGTYFNTNLTDGKMNFPERKPHPFFDGRFISFNKINANIENFYFEKDTIRAKIDLSTTERSGFTVKQLKANMRITPEIMEFSKLNLATNKSELHDYYAMHYRSFNYDMGEYITNVVMKANFKNSVVHSDDIAYFAPELKNWRKRFQISGKFDGTVADFKVKNIFLRSGNSTYASGDFESVGLPDIDKTVFTLNNGIVQTDYNELADIAPQIRQVKTPDLPALGTVRFAGKFKGTVFNFIANGNIATKLGALTTNIKLQFPDRKEPLYDGFIVSKQFNLGRFIKEPLLGAISFNGSVNGSSFSLSKMKTTLQGNVAQLHFNGYDYKNIEVNGTFQKSYFRGEFNADDPNFNLTSTVEIDLTKNIPHFNILGDLVNSDLQKLNFFNKNYQLTGLFDLNFSGRNIDEFTGSAKLLNAVLVHDSGRISFDSLSVQSDFTHTNKVLSVSSNEFDVTIDGNFTIMQLPKSLLAFLNRYYPSYIQLPPGALPRQNFSFVANTREFDKYVKLIHPNIGGLNNSTISGVVNTIDTNLVINASIPYFTYKTYIAENAVIEAKGDLQKLDVNGSVGNIILKDSLRFPNSEFTVQSKNDHSTIHIAARANTTLNEANFNADVTTYADGVKIDLNPSSFVLNDKKWNLEDQGQIILRKSQLDAHNVRFTSGIQEISVESNNSKLGDRNNLLVKLKSVNIGDFVPYVLTNPKLEGSATGSVKISDIFNKFSAEADITAEQFRMNYDSIGLVKIKAAYPLGESKVIYTIESPNNLYTFSAKGTYDVKAKPEDALQTTLDLNGANISLINQFVSTVFSGLQGQAEGRLELSGDIEAPVIIGKTTIKDASFKVNFTNVTYTVDSATILFEEDGIDFGTIAVKDRNRNTGYVRGKLYEKGFKNIRYDFDMRSDRILALDTKQGANENFYGKAIGKVNLTLRGTEDNLRMSIAAEAVDSTHIIMPPTTSRESGEADFIVFNEHGKAQDIEAANNKLRLNVDLDLLATEKAQVDIVLDDLSGDIIKAVGNGRIRMNVSNTGNVQIRGKYNIVSGSYDFNFQSLIPKKFELKGGGDNNIEWNGDPNDARINITAQYTAENISLNELIGNQNMGINNGSIRAYKGDVYVLALLSGRLSSPKIDFRIDFPSNLALRNDPTFNQFLNKLESDQSEMVKQVTWLILFQSFAPYGEAVGRFNALQTSLNTVSQVLVNGLNRLIASALNGKGWQLEVGGAFYNSSSLYGNQNAATNNNADKLRLNLKLNKRILDGRIIITVGSDFDVNVGNNPTQTNQLQLLPDVSVEFVLSNDRKLRAIIFSKSSLEVNQTAIGRRSRQGIGLSYTRDWGKTIPLKKNGEAKKEETPAIKEANNSSAKEKK